MITLLKVTDSAREEAMNLAATAGLEEIPVTLKYQGQDLTAALRDELLKKLAANEYVELEADIDAYVQQDGVRNRNCVRLTNEEVVRFAKSGKGRPFLKDHDQRSMDAVGGQISKCETVKEGEKYVVKQTVKLNEPWSVNKALRGNLTSVSISWRATGPVKCSVCNCPIITKCWHWPGDRLSEGTDAHGQKKLQYDRNGSIVVEWVYTSAEIIECSAVPVPAETQAKVTGIRTKLSTELGIHDEGIVDEQNRPTLTENPKMSDNTALVESLNAQLKKAQQLASLSDAEKDFMTRLSPTAADAFLAMGPADRTAEMKPIYTSLAGVVYDKAHGQAMISMAKQLDEQSTKAANDVAEARLTLFKTKATATLAHLALSDVEGGALLQAIDQIKLADEASTKAVKDRILEVLSTHDEAQVVKFQPQGNGKAPVAKAGAKAKYDAALAKFAKEAELDITEESELSEAEAKFLETEEGVKLYGQVENEKVQRRLAAQQGIN